jgi:prolipoprotein diacylglyceryl transferase
VNLASIPSPTTAVWYLGPIPIRAYALCIVAGIIVASVVTEIRMRRRGAPPYAVLDVAVWAVPFGIVGARIYHVITSPDAYFGAGGDFVKAFKIWEGGLGIWGAVAGGALGAWLACRQMGMPLTFVADALAPGLPLAQAIGRLGNWFNNELYGGRTDLPWGLKIYQIDTNTGKAQTDADGNPLAIPGFYQPTFLYELIWDVGVALLVWQADKRYKFGKGRAFALYVMAYTVGRAWIEAIRTDPATHVLGVRLNVWVSIVVFLGALGYFLRTRGPQEFIVPADRRFRVVTEEEFAEHRAGAAASAKGGEPGETTEAADLTDEGAEAEGEAAESGSEVAEKPDAAEKPSAAEEPDEDAPARAEAATRDDR